MVAIIHGRNVCDNYAEAVRMVRGLGEQEKSRAGDVLVVPTPVITITDRSTERVLTDPGRDANPFFHFFESLWMLSGSRDATWLDQFVHDFSSRFAEPGGIQWGAYGHRWRKHWSQDQLDWIVQMLRKNPLDRRAVLSMWDPSADLFSPPDGVRDLPCNLQVIPRMRRVAAGARLSRRQNPAEFVLDITITNRSNDVVWGCYGANAVHFSFLHEYLAGRIGCHVGTMYQLSNNWHAYTDTLEKVGEPTGENLYANSVIKALPIGEYWDHWDQDLALFMHDPSQHRIFTNNWFSDVAVQMFRAHYFWKKREWDLAKIGARLIDASDWRHAVLEWMERRSGS